MKRTQPHNYFQKEENLMKVTEMKHVREEKKTKKQKNEGAPGSMLQWAMSALHR